MAENTDRLKTLIDEYRWQHRPQPLTVVEFARLVGVSPAAVHSWRNGTSKPEMERLWTIHEKTGIPFSELASAAGYGSFVDASVFVAYLIEHVDEQLPASDAGERERFKRWLESLRAGEAAGAVLVTNDSETGRHQIAIAEERSGEYRTVFEGEIPPGR